MSAHTPGPWDVCRRAHLHGVQHVDHSGKMYDVCRVDWHSFYKPDHRAEANARLIAAAPDLLEALQAILHTYDDGGVPLNKAFRMANAAIARATEQGHE